MLRRGLLILALLALLGAAAWYFLGRAPGWWSPPRQDDARAMQSAEHLERRLTEEMSKVRPDEAPWAVRLGEEQLNAWLALRLPKWIAHAGEHVDVAAQVRVRRGAIDVAVRPILADGAVGPVGVVTLRPALLDGTIGAELEGAGIGRVILPGSAAERAIAAVESVLRSAEAQGSEAGDRHAADLMAAILRGERVPARWRLGDGREIELLDLELTPGSIVVQCATLRR